MSNRINPPPSSNCCQILFESKYTDAVILVTSLALAVLGALALTGLLPLPGSVNGYYFAYGFFGGAAFLVVAVCVKAVYLCIRKQSPIKIPHKQVLDKIISPQKRSIRSANQLHRACKEGDVDNLKKLLSRLSQPSQRISLGPNKRTLLHSLAEVEYDLSLENARTAVGMLVNRVGLGTIDSEGWTATMRAIANGNFNLAKALIEKGGEVPENAVHLCCGVLYIEEETYRDFFQFLINQEFSNFSIDVISNAIDPLLLETAPDTQNFEKYFSRMTPLQHAAALGNPDAVSALCNCGANVNYSAMGTYGNALHYALKPLLKHNWLVDEYIAQDLTLEMRCKAICILINKGVDVQSKDSEGVTPEDLFVKLPEEIQNQIKTLLNG